MRKGRGRMFDLPEGGWIGPINQAVAAHIRKLIADGAISPGVRLPAQRLLAQDFRVSRNTITAALQQLSKEGVLIARVGAGTYVARDAAPSAKVRRGAIAPAEAHPLPFEPGVPDVDLFPRETWRRVQTQVWKSLPASALADVHPAGWPGLRAIIAQRMSATRGVACSAEQVFIVSSTQAATEFAARCLTLPGETALMEDPGYFRARQALRDAGLHVEPAPVDVDGIDVSKARCVQPARIAYVTPGVQVPTGARLSASRRRALIEWASAQDAWIIEDDYEAEFAFEGRAARPLAADPGADRVALVGTLNNLLFPALGVAFVIAPERAQERFERAAAGALRATNTPTQVTLQAFMDQGHLAAHVRMCRGVYEERRSVLQEALKRRLGGQIEVDTPAQGLRIHAWLGKLDDRAVKRAAADRAVAVTAMTDHAKLPAKSGLLLGFAPYKPPVLRAAVDQLAQAIESLARGV